MYNIKLIGNYHFPSADLLLAPVDFSEAFLTIEVEPMCMVEAFGIENIKLITTEYYDYDFYDLME